jgi:tetratricopeptide (TPR) repeat protein
MAARLSLAAFQAYDTENRMAHWAEAGYMQDERELNDLYEAALSSARRFPLNPRHVEIRARLLEWISFLQRLTPEYARRHRHEAVAVYRELLELAPSYGYAWAGMAELRAYDGLLDEETTGALDNAVRLHPVEDSTQRRVIRTGIQHWFSLPESSRESVNIAIGNALKTNTTLQDYPITLFVFDTAIRGNWEHGLEPFLTDERIEAAFAARRRYLAAESGSD